MAASFATRYKKDLSIGTLKTKLVRRKSLLQKESRHKEFNKGRQFGPVDVNRPLPEDKEISCLEEKDEVPIKAAKSSQTGNGNTVKQRTQERLQMLQRYKTEKELRKLKEQREKPVFRVGRYKPEIPSFLPQASQIPVLCKPKEKAAVATAAPSVRVTRLQAKKQLEETVKSSSRSRLPAVAPSFPSKGCILRPPAPRHKIYVDQPPKEEDKGAQPSVSRGTNGRTTRATAAASTKIPRAQKLISDNLPQKRSTKNGKQQNGAKNAAGETGLQKAKVNPVLEAVKEESISEVLPAVDTEQDEVILEKENMPELDCSFASIPAPALSRRTRSFAPQNFLFQPPEGLTTYKVAPLSPSTADVFLSPNLCWTPTKSTSESPEESAKDTNAQDCSLKCPPSSNPALAEEDLQKCSPALESVETKPECLVPCNEEMDIVPHQREDALQHVDFPMTEIPGLSGEPQHDVAYFRKILQSETERLTSHCLEWDGATETDIPEEAKDLVRTTVGQSRLLMAERFKQFEGLVDNCEFKRGEKETTCADLDGFWDMVNFQVEDVIKKFENLKQLQKNGWQMVDDIQPNRPAKKKAAIQRVAKQKGGSAETTAARKRLQAIKAIMKNKMKQDMVAEAVDPEEEEEKVVFDGGFFQVESPARPLQGRISKSAKTPRQSSRRSTPRSASRAFLQSCAETCETRGGPAGLSNSFLNPFGADLGCISEQSDTQFALGPCAKMEDLKGEADPNADLSLFFSPLKREAETPKAATTCDDLIVFSPLGVKNEGLN